MLFRLDFNIDSSATTTADVGVNQLDFDEIIDPTTNVEALKIIKINLATLIQNMFSQYNSVNVFQAKISGIEIVLNGIRIRNFLLQVKSQANDFLVNNLKFYLSENSYCSFW